MLFDDYYSKLSELLDTKQRERAEKLFMSITKRYPREEIPPKLLALFNPPEENNQAKNILNILFLQDSPCIRNYKYAQALKKLGHKVSLAYLVKKLSERYPGLSDDVYQECIKIKDLNELWDLSKRFDIIHSHNEPDQYTVAALAAHCPVIHDTHDLVSLRDYKKPEMKYFEGIANRAAHGRIYSTPYQRDEAKAMYQVEGDSLVVYNYASAEDIPDQFYPKASVQDGYLHMVYEGGVGGSEHRSFTQVFIDIAQAGVKLHIFPARYDEKIARELSTYPNIDYRHPVSPKDIIKEMSRFDIGIIPWNLNELNERFLSSTIANKLFEYFAAGLPVATADITSYRDYFQSHPVGVTFKSVPELISKVPYLLKLKDNIDFKKLVFTYDQEIHKVVDYYHQVIERNKTREKDLELKVAEKNRMKLSNHDTSILNLIKWIEDNGWSGYDPYDAEDYIITQKKQGKGLGEEKEKEIRKANNLHPLELRKTLNISKKINAKALGLMLSSYCQLYQVFQDEKYIQEAERIAKYLAQNSSKSSKNKCWGYPFDWQSIIFIPEDTPSVVVSTVVGDGFWSLYQISKNSNYLDICASICCFITEDLNIDYLDENRVCFSYTPIDDYHVHNSNLFAAEFLIRVGQKIKRMDFIELGIKAVNYALSEQNSDGSIFYWGRKQNHYNANHLDSYHSGFEIRMLYRIYLMTLDQRVKDAYISYLEFFKRTFVRNDGFVYQFLPHKNQYQSNIHGIAEVILLYSVLLKDHPDLKGSLEKVIDYAEKELQDQSGFFGYLIQKDNKLMIPYLRWGEAWMLKAYSEYLTQISEKRITKNYSNIHICHVGGAHSVHVADIIRELDRFGFHQFVISYMPVEKSITDEHIKVYYFPYRDYMKEGINLDLFNQKLYEFLGEVFSKEKVDIVQGHSLTYSAPILIQSSKMFKKNCAVIPWNTLSIKSPQTVINQYEAEALSVIDYLFHGMPKAVSMFKAFYKNIGSYQYKEFRTMMPFEHYQRNREISQEVNILSVRVMGENYKQELLIRSLPLIIRKVPGLKVTFLIGQDADQGRVYFEQMKTLAQELGVATYCRFIDRSLSQAELADMIYAHSIVYCVATHDEGFSVSATVSMYSGAICIVQETEENEDLIDKKHLLKVQINQSSIQEALIYAIDHLEELQRRFMQENQYLIKYSKDKMIQNLIDAYDDMYAGMGASK